MNFIEHIREPEKLVLCWQSPQAISRTRLVIAELRRIGNNHSFKYLKDTEDFMKAKEFGFTMYPALRVHQEMHTSGVLEAFIGRIPPRSRNDFVEYLRNFRLQKDAKISDFALLGYSGAKLPSDGFSIVDPLENVFVPCELLIELAGTRYIKDLLLNAIQIGDTVEFIKEPDNQYDPQAIFVISKGQKIGYINRVQTNAFHEWLASDNVHLSANIERFNGNSERPLIYIFLRLSPE